MLFTRSTPLKKILIKKKGNNKWLVGSIPYENVYIYPYHILTFMCENFVGVARWTVIISGGAARWTEAISGGATVEKKIHV